MLSGALGLVTFIANGLRSTLSVILALPFRIQFMALWLLGLLFLLFNAPAFYGDNASQQTTVLLLYMVSLAFVFSQTRERNPLLGISTAEFVLTFVLWFSVAALLFKVVQPFSGAEAPLLTTENVLVLLTHALVVAIGEELLFRFALPSILPGPRIAAQVLSAVAFGLMHFSAYGGDVQNLLFATILGIVFGAITVRYHRGLIIAMAAHAAFNAAVLGFI